MIENVVRDYLVSVSRVPVLLEKPPNPPINYFLIEKVGGGERNHIYTATFAIQSYSDTLEHAAMLNDELKSMMDGLIMNEFIASVKLNSDYNYTDTGTKTYRYQAVYDIVHY